MQSKLEVGRAGRHHGMIVTPPRLNLRRGASYQLEKGRPLSATSSRFSFNHLLFSPPPSPSLPALVPRPKKSPTRARPTRVFRLVAWIAGTLFIVYVASRVVRRHVDLNPVRMTFIAPRTEEFEMVSQNGLPDFPTPIMAKDAWGRSSWTVSIPKDHDFPLGVREYTDIMDSCHEVAATVRGSRDWTGKSNQQTTSMTSYGVSDPYYVDVRRAEKSGLLPTGAPDEQNQKAKRSHSRGNLVGASEDQNLPECETSLTVVLETSDAGLGSTLMMLWTAYGIAAEQGRAFFVDDSRWAYGRYTSMFEAPPTAGCRAPPRHEMVPCPTQAAHLVVSSATARHVLMDSLSSGGATDAEQARKRVFGLARRGYEALFRVVKEDADYIGRRVKDLALKATKAGVPVAGMHIRRGDCHPLAAPYSASYIPNEIYAESARSALSALSSASRAGGELFVLASDDPTIYAADEFSHAHHAQERIKLASKEADNLERARKQRNPHVFHRFVDEAFGWEGGFFSAMFWNLGQPRGAAPGSFESIRDAAEETVKLRGYLGRAYVLDLAVLAQSGDVVVCAVGSMGCRLLGVMMGWEAVEAGRWVNIDGEHGWMGLTW
ncbi:uncharacterized protein DNG_00572 [Cephalotrichum gorgonifer]|uniref:Uncharacterized protein n=1 Tax=Cephalotrichum gorgonifer TaxID=2041049 RepID=A0AAE8MR95_9PEZI|nr:uncharacterized protein DNG_00572 [Cephalotrichum gorgonifer]